MPRWLCGEGSIEVRFYDIYRVQLDGIYYVIRVLISVSKEVCLYEFVNFKQYFVDDIFYTLSKYPMYESDQESSKTFIFVRSI